MTTVSNFVRYTDDVEVIQTDEEKYTRQAVDSFNRLNKTNFENYNHAVRGAHAKSQGVLNGTLQVYADLPEYLRQGVFKDTKTFPLIARFSSAPGRIMPDSMLSFYGLALKLLEVDGPKILPEKAAARTQDFLFINHPVLPAGDVESYAKQQTRLEKVSGAPDGMQSATSKGMALVRKGMCPFGYDPVNLLGMGKVRNHILGETFFTAGAIRYGEYIAKLSVAPLSANVRGLHGKPIESSATTAISDCVAKFFTESEASFELRVQLSTNLDEMPIEDASVEWSQEKSRYIGVGIITFPKQATYTPARRVYADDTLSFNPFHSVTEHRPLGSVMRARRPAYEASSRYRHEKNAVSEHEPETVNELPA